MRRKYSSLRLKGFDYSSAAGYFVTIKISRTRCTLGNVLNGVVERSPAGEITHDCWIEIPQHFKGVVLDEFVIMPDHIHGIIILRDFDSSKEILHSRRGGACAARLKKDSHPLLTIINGYKAAVTKHCQRSGIRDFQWQRGYYEHVVRGEKELHQIRQYIRNNPTQWTSNRRPD